MFVEQRTKIFPGRYEYLSDIAEFVQLASHDAGFDSSMTYAVETAVDEACSNVIEHAYGGEGIGDITLICEIEQNLLTIKIIDQGQPFNPDSVPGPYLDKNCEDHPGHGLGLYFIKSLMDDVKFEFTPGVGTTLTMVKRREQDV